jgi:hypothetical protein
VRWINKLIEFLKDRLGQHRSCQPPDPEAVPATPGNLAYWRRIRETLSRFCSPTDQLHCPRVFFRPGQTCQLCGHWPITKNYVLWNPRTRQRLVVGCWCINNYMERLARMDYTAPPVKFASLEESERVNQAFPGIAVYGGAPDSDRSGLDDWEGAEDREALMDMGLDPGDPDFSELAPHGMTGESDDDGWPPDYDEDPDECDHTAWD